MRILVALALFLLAGCNQPTGSAIQSCEEIDPKPANMPVDTFMTLSSGQPCDFSGSCLFGETQPVCGAPSDLKEVRCTCMEGAIRCFDLTNELAARNMACGS